MTSDKTQSVLKRISSRDFKLGDLKKIAREIKADHAMAEELWQQSEPKAQLLATLLFDKKQITEARIESLAADIENRNGELGEQLADWLLANQLSKSAKTKALLGSWQNHRSPVLRRLFWYQQARLRWTGQTPPGNSAQLLKDLELNLENAEGGEQWAMNFCAAQIGIHESEYRQRCVELGERLGLYRDEKVSRNCTPNYLPEFIRIEVAKRA